MARYKVGGKIYHTIGEINSNTIFKLLPRINIFKPEIKIIYSG